MVISWDYGKRKEGFSGKIGNDRGIEVKGKKEYVYWIMGGMVVKRGKNKGLGNYVEVGDGDFSCMYGDL